MYYCTQSITAKCGESNINEIKERNMERKIAVTSNCRRNNHKPAKLMACGLKSICNGTHYLVYQPIINHRAANALEQFKQCLNFTDGDCKIT